MTFPTPSSDEHRPRVIGAASPGRGRPAPRSRRFRPGQEGFTLAALIVILTIMAIVVAYTVPQQWSMVMKRERERQTIFLMKQYARGIREFQRKHKTLPVSLKQLQEAKSPRTIRGGGKWACPLTGGEEDWILVPPGTTGAPQPGAQPGGMPGGRQERDRDASRRGPGGFGTGSPDDYVGQFVGVRPKASGKSMIALNGAEDYSEWVYTITDLENEIATRNLALAVPGAP